MKKIKILGQEIKVKVMNKKEMQLHTSGDDCGFFSCDKSLIGINQSLNSFEKNELYIMR